MRHLLLLSLTLLFLAGTAEAASITSATIETLGGCNPFSIVASLSGPGLSASGGDIGICDTTPLPPFLPGALVTFDLLLATPARGPGCPGPLGCTVVDGEPGAILIGHPLSELEVGATFSVLVPLNSTEEIITLTGPATGGANLLFVGVNGTREDFQLGHAIGTGTVTLLRLISGDVTSPQCDSGVCYQIDGSPGRAPSATLSAVPEPSTWLLLGSGLVGLTAWRRKKSVSSEARS